MQNPFAHATFRDHSRRFIAVVVVLAGLLLAAGFAAKPAWHSLKDRRALKFVAKARAAMATNGFGISTANLQAAFKLSPALPDVLRAAGEQYTLMGSSYGLQVWGQLEATGSMTAEDRMKWAHLALATRAPRLALKALAPFSATNSTNPDALALLSKIYSAAGDIGAARQAATEAWQRAPLRMDLLLNLGTLEMGNPEPVVSNEGVSKLMTLLVGTNRAAGSAALVLLSPDFSNRVSARLVSRLIRDHPLATDEMDLAKLVVQMRSAPAMAREQVALFLGNVPAFWEQRRFRNLVQCLLQMREFHPLLGLVSEDSAVRSDELCSIRLEALWRVGDWNAIRSLLDRPESRASKPLEALYRAMLANAEGRTNEVARLWDAAITASRRDNDLLEVIATRAEAAHTLREATRAWRELMVFPESTERAGREILRLTGQTGDLESAYAAFRYLAQIFPANMDLRLNVALHQLLLRVDEAEATKLLEGLTPIERETDLGKVTAALAALRGANPDQALQLVKSMNCDWEKAPPIWRTIRIAALGQTGQKLLARKLATESREMLSGAETDLLKEWLP